jgi:hypothetical protein
LANGSVTSWEDLEKKFHAYFFTGTGEKKLTDLTIMRQMNNESGLEYLQRFRHNRSMYFTLTLSDDQLAALAVQGMLSYLKDKLIGQHFDNLGFLTQKLQLCLNSGNINATIPSIRKLQQVADFYDFVLNEESDKEDIDAIEWNWDKKQVVIPNPWGRSQKTYDFDITKDEKVFDYLFEKGQIKLSPGKVILKSEERRSKKYCKVHNSLTHSTNECKVFKQQIQSAIEQGRLTFDKPNKSKMKIDEQPFPQNMFNATLPKSKVMILTSDKAKKSGTVESSLQMTAREYQKIQQGREEQKSQFEQGESSRSVSLRPRVTSRILLNKWQRQKEKDYKRWLEEQEYQQRLEEEMYEREQTKTHWNCPFFRHCWNEGLRLPTKDNCPECYNQSRERRQSETNHRSVHERIR